MELVAKAPNREIELASTDGGGRRWTAQHPTNRPTIMQDLKDLFTPDRERPGGPHRSAPRVNLANFTSPRSAGAIIGQDRQSVLSRNGSNRRKL